QCKEVTEPGTTIRVYDPTTDFRGNITQITRYADTAQSNAVKSADVPTSSGPVTELRRYDITGNTISVAGSCCVQASFIYKPNTQYAYPEGITRGATADPTARLTQSFTYDSDAGLKLTSTDANQLTTRMEYDESLRLHRLLLPTSASLNYQYDDAGMAMTRTVQDANGATAAQDIDRYNGLGLVQRVESLADANTWNAVSEQYDAVGRISRRSQPYQLPQQASFWTTFSYDSLGRVIAVQNPHGSQA